VDEISVSILNLLRDGATDKKKQSTDDADYMIRRDPVWTLNAGTLNAEH
jgi:hypothetical protein